MGTAAGFPFRQTFFDGVLMRTAEGGEDQFAGIRLARGDGHAGAAFIDGDQLAQMGKIQPGINAVHVEIQGHGHEVQVAGAFAVAKERALDAVRPGEQTEFRGGDAGAPVIVGVQADDEGVAVLQVAAHPLDLIGVDVGHGHLDRVGQVQNHLVFRRGLPDVHDGLGDFPGKFHFRAAETFR